MRGMGVACHRGERGHPAVGLLAARRQSLVGEPIESGGICEALVPCPCEDVCASPTSVQAEFCSLSPTGDVTLREGVAVGEEGRGEGEFSDPRVGPITPPSPPQ